MSDTTKILIEVACTGFALGLVLGVLFGLALGERVRH